MMQGRLSPAIVLAACLLFGLLHHAAAEAYLEALPDLPLMPGFEEAPDAGVAFDKPEGRIVTAYAHGEARREAVRSFYVEALPALGWRAAGTDSFEREGERLDIDYLGSRGDLTLRFTLQPQR